MKRKKTNEEFLVEVYSLVGTDYEFLERYINTDTKITVRHDACGTEYKVTPHKFLQGKRCAKCQYDSQRLPISEIKRRLREIHGLEYELIGDYHKRNSKTTFRHVTCGATFQTRPDNLLRGKGCPNCRVSKGERVVEEKLQSMSLDYKKEVSLDGCVHKGPLRFDFAVFRNETLAGLIEYDGEFHYMSIPTLGGDVAFNAIKIRDGIKNDYCKQNAIPLLRIPFYKLSEAPMLIDDFAREIGIGA